MPYFDYIDAAHLFLLDYVNFFLEAIKECSCLNHLLKKRKCLYKNFNKEKTIKKKMVTNYCFEVKHN